MSTIAYFHAPGGGGGVLATIIVAGLGVAHEPTLAHERLRVLSAARARSTPRMSFTRPRNKSALRHDPT
jgi:hypothetical protein